MRPWIFTFDMPYMPSFPKASIINHRVLLPTVQATGYRLQATGYSYKLQATPPRPLQYLVGDSPLVHNYVVYASDAPSVASGLRDTDLYSCARSSAITPNAVACALALHETKQKEGR